MSEQSNSHREKEQASAIRPRDRKLSANTRLQESFKRSSRYTVPTHYRPGKRCAAAKRKLGDDLLTVVALVPGSPFGFKRRNLMRKYLSGPAHKMRSREFYRKVLTLSVPKIQPLFEFYIARNANLQDDFKGVNHTNYTTYKWGWFSKMLGKPMLDPRALCIEVIFAVGLPLAPWAPGEAEKLARLSREAEEYNDILIGPYLDGRGKGKAMTQKTIYLLWWSTFHLSYADHVYKVDTDTFVKFRALVQVLPPPSKNPSLQWVGHLHGRYWTEGLGPACGNGELYGFSQPLLQLFRPLIETPAHVEFFLRNPVHVIADQEGKMTDPIPYGLRFPEDFVACSLVTQAVIGHEDRFEDKILEGPDYFPMWVHHLKRNRSYVACATGVNCTGEPNYRNTMPSLDDLVLPHL